MTFENILNKSTSLKFMLLVVFVWVLGFKCQAQQDNPVVTYAVQNPDEVKQEETFQIDVKFTVQPQWYLYAPTGNNEVLGMVETKIVFRLPEGINRLGRIRIPEPNYKDGYEVYEGSITMSQALQASTSLMPGTYEIKGIVTWQACKNDICLPPITEEITLAIKVK